MALPIEPSEKQKESEFGKLLKEREEKFVLAEGKIVKGKIVSLTDDFAMIDIGFKSEGQIPLREFKNVKGELTVQAGDEIEVLLESVENDQGMMILSKERADTYKAWDSLVKIQGEGGLVEGVILGKVKGGLAVDVGVKAFLPGSQVDVRPVRNLDKYIGKHSRFKIVKLNKRRGNIVLSRKDVLEKDQEHIKERALQHIKEGQVLEGTIKNITDYGCFVDLGGIDGLLHVTDMSWSRIHHPSDLFKVGTTIKVIILKFDEANQRVSLGVKQLQEDPWSQVEGKFPVGSRVKGKIVSMTDYGAFMELSLGIEGLIHISEISWNRKIKHPSQTLSLGQELEAIVLDSDVTNRRIALGLKQLQPNPWDTLESHHPIGSRVNGVVRNVTDFGLFLDCGVGIDGLIHISDVDWVQNFSHPQEMFKKGDSLEAVVLHIDKENERFSLSLKQLKPNPWETIRSNYPQGSEVEGSVLQMNAAGAVIGLKEDVTGLLPKAKCPPEIKVGDPLNLVVQTLDEEGRKFHFKLKE